MISILMPIYNGIEFIHESVPSIIHQSFKDWELIIGINGHSKDSEVYKKAKEWQIKDDRIKVYDLYTIKGKSNALNEMINCCKNDWISLLDSHFIGTINHLIGFPIQSIKCYTRKNKDLYILIKINI